MPFEEYKEAPDVVPLNCLEEDIAQVSMKLSGSAGGDGAEVVNVPNWKVTEEL